MVGRDVTYKFIEIKSPSPLQGDVLLSHYVDCDVRGIMLALSCDAIILFTNNALVAVRSTPPPILTKKKLPPMCHRRQQCSGSRRAVRPDLAHDRWQRRVEPPEAVENDGTHVRKVLEEGLVGDLALPLIAGGNELICSWCSCYICWIN